MNLISFSGIDGAGKSTQIEILQRHLTDLGFRSKVFTFWDDVAAFAALRERASHRIFQGEQGIGSPANPIRRRDKNVTVWYASAFRLLLYLFDALRLRIFVHKASAVEEVVIFDRYIYDELANLPLERRTVRLYLRFLLHLIPKPDIAFLLDADPNAATARKPEYPLDFVRRNREAYLNLSRIVGMAVMPGLSPERVAERIRESMFNEHPQDQAAVPGLPVESPAANTPNL